MPPTHWLRGCTATHAEFLRDRTIHRCVTAVCGPCAALPADGLGLALFDSIMADEAGNGLASSLISVPPLSSSSLLSHSLATAAGQKPATLLQPPLPCGWGFNRDGEGVSAMKRWSSLAGGPAGHDIQLGIPRAAALSQGAAVFTALSQGFSTFHCPFRTAFPLTFHCPFYCLSSTFHCFSTAFPRLQGLSQPLPPPPSSALSPSIPRTNHQH